MKERKNIAKGYLRGTSVTPRLLLKRSAALKALLLGYYLNLFHGCIVELIPNAILEGNIKHERQKENAWT